MKHSTNNLLNFFEVLLKNLTDSFSLKVAKIKKTQIPMFAKGHTVESTKHKQKCFTTFVNLSSLENEYLKRNFPFYSMYV